MGHKVHPIGFRLGVVKGWQSRWYAEREYKDILAEDFKLRKIIQHDLANASVSRTEIERAAANQVSITIHTARPGIVIGKSGEKVDKLRAQLEKETKKRVKLNILEIRQPELDAYLVARSVAEQLEKRVSFRRAMKQAVQKTMRANAKGIRIVVGGRLGGTEIARSEKEVEGKIPLHTLRADIDYGMAEAHTTFGVIGVKVWIYKGDILPSRRREALEGPHEAASSFLTSERGEGERRGSRAGDRGGRGERGAPRGDRPGRAQGERPARTQAQGERAQRSSRPQGERSSSRSQSAQGQSERERSPRPPRAQGERPARPARAARTEKPEQAAEQPTESAQPTEQQVEQAPVAEMTGQVQAPETTQAERVEQVEQASGAETTEAGAPESE